jgi:8-oxo-dGTP diphosphatase
LNYTQTIKLVDPSTITATKFTSYFVSCLVITKDNKILLQHRTADARSYPEHLATFGGGIEIGESPIQALVRELEEELGAKVKPNDVIYIGAITEEITNHTELLHTYFWHDKLGTITGCYEGEPRFYPNFSEAQKHPKIMDYVQWLYHQCQQRGLLG